MPRTLVVMPTYNECASIEGMAERLRAASPDTELLIVDDGSPDGTGDIADRVGARDPLVHVLHRSQKNGLGEAYRAGFAWAFARNFEILVEMDADGSHRPEQLPRLLAALENADLVIGSRWVDGGEVEDWPIARHLISRGGSAYARLALGIPQRDVTGGYRAYRADALAAVLASSQISHGYGFQVELLWRAMRAGLRVVEVPISFSERQHGASKMSAGIVLEAMLLVTRWGIASIPERMRRPAKQDARHVHA